MVQKVIFKINTILFTILILAVVSAHGQDSVKYAAGSLGFSADSEPELSEWDEASARINDYRMKMLETEHPWFINIIVMAIAALALMLFILYRSHGEAKRLEILVSQRTNEVREANEEINKSIDKIRETEEYTQLLLDGIPMSCMLWNREFQMVNCNKEAVNLFGFTDKQDFLNRFIDTCSPEFQPDGQRSDEKSLLMLNKGFAEGNHIFEWQHYDINGDIIPAEVTVVRLKYREGYLVAFYIRDLREYKTHLSDIKKAMEKAEAASKTKSLFLANMSHEIRTPMNSIIGFSELALFDDISLKTREYLTNISESAKWLLAIINDILDITKIEAGKVLLERIPFDLYDVLAQCRSVISPKTVQKGIALYFYADPSIENKLLGDPVRLQQVLINILSNAVKFTNIGKIKLLVSLVKSDKKSATINFEIKDSGIGMSSEQVEKIFEPFTQADDSITRRFGGTGLGLPITKNIIELMGGSLVVDSLPGVGSNFSFELTFELTGDKTCVSPVKSAVNRSQVPVFKGEVLICEDNSLNQQVLSGHLTKVGLKYTIANNGLEGIIYILERKSRNERPFDLIFMDIQMPVMDGLEASSKISAMRTKTPIVALTANIMSNDIELYKTNGISDYLGKPFTTQELWKCLFKYLPAESFYTVDKNRQTDDDEKLLKKLRINFVKSNQTLYADIINAIKTNDTNLAFRLLHTLKSNAGQIGAFKLQETAASIENEMQNEKTPSEETLAWLETGLKSVLDELAPLLAAQLLVESNMKKTAKPIAPEEIPGLLEKLEVYLKNKDTECLKLLDDISVLSESEPELQAAIVNFMEEFEFKKALETLFILKEKLGIKLCKL